MREKTREKDREQERKNMATIAMVLSQVSGFAPAPIDKTQTPHRATQITRLTGW